MVTRLCWLKTVTNIEIAFWWKSWARVNISHIRIPNDQISDFGVNSIVRNVSGENQFIAEIFEFRTHATKKHGSPLPIFKSSSIKSQFRYSSCRKFFIRQIFTFVRLKWVTTNLMYGHFRNKQDFTCSQSQAYSWKQRAHGKRSHAG